MRHIRATLRYVPLVLLASLYVFPVLMTFTNSFMGQIELTGLYGNDASKLRIIPWQFSLEGYYKLLFASGDYLKMFWNSVLIAAAITTGHVFASVVVAYILAKVKLRGRKMLLFLYIVVMMMPFQVTLLPNYIMIKGFNLYNTNWALILPGIFAPFGVFLMHQFISGISNDVIEAITLESSSPFRLLVNVVVPAVYPGILALAVLNFAENWNMVEQPLILLKDEWKYPLSLALNSVSNDGLDIAFVGAVLYMIPIVLIYRVFEEELIAGLGRARF